MAGGKKKKVKKSKKKKDVAKKALEEVVLQIEGQDCKVIEEEAGVTKTTLHVEQETQVVTTVVQREVTPVSMTVTCEEKKAPPPAPEPPKPEPPEPPKVEPPEPQPEPEPEPEPEPPKKVMQYQTVVRVKPASFYKREDTPQGPSVAQFHFHACQEAGCQNVVSLNAGQGQGGRAGAAQDSQANDDPIERAKQKRAQYYTLIPLGEVQTQQAQSEEGSQKGGKGGTSKTDEGTAVQEAMLEGMCQSEGGGSQQSALECSSSSGCEGGSSSASSKSEGGSSSASSKSEGGMSTSQKEASTQQSALECSSSSGCEGGSSSASSQSEAQEEAKTNPSCGVGNQPHERHCCWYCKCP